MGAWEGCAARRASIWRVTTTDRGRPALVPHGSPPGTFWRFQLFGFLGGTCVGLVHLIIALAPLVSGFPSADQWASFYGWIFLAALAVFPIPVTIGTIVGALTGLTSPAFYRVRSRLARVASLALASAVLVMALNVLAIWIFAQLHRGAFSFEGSGVALGLPVAVTLVCTASLSPVLVFRRPDRPARTAEPE